MFQAKRLLLLASSVLIIYLLVSNDIRFNKKKLTYIPGTIIPAKIHQTSKERPFDYIFGRYRNERHMKAWKNRNLDFEYYFWTDDGVVAFVKEHYPQYYNDFLKLPTAVLKVDVFRYMVLNTMGGVYSDSDTIALKPVGKWIKPHWRCKDTKFIVGVEFDIPFRYGNVWRNFHSNPVQFSQWTIASVPNYEILNTMLAQIFGIVQNSTVAELSAMDVIEFTGPSRWTNVIFSTWEGYNVDDFRGFGDDPKCFSNKLILPITCFNPGLNDAWDYGPMGSRSIYDPDALVKHMYDGSWR